MLRISLAEFTDPALRLFLQAHLDDIAPTAPPQSQHALDLDALAAPGVRLWTAHEADKLVGTIALADLGQHHEELKSMRTDPARRGQGIATRLLLHALADARSRGVVQIWLETGSMAFFAPARTLYRSHGFVECGPFASYAEDPNSTFMTLGLAPS